MATAERRCPWRWVVPLAAFVPLVAFLLDASAQPPARARDGNQVVRGTVQRLTTAKKGELDGLVLDDGTWVHWPPHLEARFKDVAGKGDRVRAIGRTETGKKGETKFEVESLTNLTRGKSVDLGEDSERAAPAAERERRLQQLEREVEKIRAELDRLRAPR